MQILKAWVGLGGQLSFFCCFFLPPQCVFLVFRRFLWSIDWRRKKGQRRSKILSPGITSSSAPGFCLEGDMASGMHLQIPVQYQLVWSHNQRFRRNTISNWWQEVWINMLPSFPISRICEDNCVSWVVRKTASAEEGVIEWRRWPLLWASASWSPLPLPSGFTGWSGQDGNGKSWTWTHHADFHSSEWLLAFLNVQPANRWHWL